MGSGENALIGPFVQGARYGAGTESHWTVPGITRTGSKTLRQISYTGRYCRAIELTPKGEVASDYRSPQRKTVEGRQYVMPLFDVVRIDPAYLKQDMSDGREA